MYNGSVVYVVIDISDISDTSVMNIFSNFYNTNIIINKSVSVIGVYINLEDAEIIRKRSPNTRSIIATRFYFKAYTDNDIDGDYMEI